MSRAILIYILLLFTSFLTAQQKRMVPYDHVLSDKELVDLLDTDIDCLKSIKANYDKGNRDNALEELTNYFKEVFSSRYFFSWKEFDQRFEEYNRTYKSQKEYHYNTAFQHLDLYPAVVEWKLPFNNKKGDAVTAYQYRHLARQHQADDIAFLYHYTKDVQYLNYIPEQAGSINEAFNKGEVETINDGNGAYEAFRGGNRMYNWLFAHQCLLASDDYSWRQQLTMIKTFLHTGAKLYHHNPSYYEGNHQTRGMSALAMLAILFQEIEGTDLWLDRSKSLLEDHLRKEIYADNFQFERSVHYHISDIKNYSLPYQIAKINNIDLGLEWDKRISGLFDAFVKLALPNKGAPVLQDDTDSPWAEFNDISGIMAYGTALFNRPDFKYFAAKEVSADDYWLLSSQQVKDLKDCKSSSPEVLSTEFDEAGYYIMRTGWADSDYYMVVSAGLSAEKPDHQHGDMLGVQAYAFGNMVLPNYQVRYSLTDLDYFKNSWVKNVALVDSIPQGQVWKGNKGGSGFGNYTDLPEPKVIAWNKFEDIDIFIGKHNGFEDLNVDYLRKVLFIKDGFWIVKDEFKTESSDKKYQQVWQGHYSDEIDGRHYRSVFPDGVGLDIIQLGSPASKVSSSVSRGKGNLVLESEEEGNFTFTTLLYPFKGFDQRIEGAEGLSTFKIGSWIVTTSRHSKNSHTKDTDAEIELRKDKKILLFNASFFQEDGKEIRIQNTKGDIFINIQDNTWQLLNCSSHNIKILFGQEELLLKPGEEGELRL